MALSMIDKLTNYLMPTEEVEEKEKEKPKPVAPTPVSQGSKVVNLSVHTNQSAKLKVLIVSAAKQEDVRNYADHLKANIAVVINLTGVDGSVQETIKDFMNGVCYVLSGNVQSVAECVLLYTPSGVDIEKELYAYSVPPYVKTKAE